MGPLSPVRGVDDPRRLQSDAAARDVTIVSVMVHDYDGRTDKLELIRGLADEGRLTMRVATTMPYAAAAEARRALEAGGVRGRIVLTF